MQIYCFKTKKITITTLNAFKSHNLIPTPRLREAHSPSLSPIKKKQNNIYLSHKLNLLIIIIKLSKNRKKKFYRSLIYSSLPESHVSLSEFLILFPYACSRYLSCIGIIECWVTDSSPDMKLTLSIRCRHASRTHL